MPATPTSAPATPASSAAGAHTSSQRRRERNEWTADEWQAIQDAIEKADPGTISQALARIATNFPNAFWLGRDHRVGKNPRNIKQQAPHQPDLADAIAEYAAASAPLHLADAWTYFGRALGALSAGAIDVAQHLLYYCELRAMHALLHRHGVVILNENFAFSPSGSVRIPFPIESRHIETNSHQSMWVLFDRWVGTTEGIAFFGDSVRLNGVSLTTWAAERPLEKTVSGAMTPLVKTWGIDINRFSQDRTRRNQGSYQPTRLYPEATGVTPEFVGKLFEEVWSLLEPHEDDPFQSLDRHVARLAFDAFAQSDPTSSTDSDLSKSVRADAGDETEESEERVAEEEGDDERLEDVYYPEGYESMSAYWADKVLGKGSGRFVTEFLEDRVAYPTPRILSAAGEDLDDGSLAARFQGMTGRALILLRFATGATRDMLLEARCSADDIQFWLGDMLTLHGIRIPDNSNYLDLWLDVEEAVPKLSELAGDLQPENIAVLRERLAGSFATLSGFERVPAWAVAPPPDPDRAVA